MKKFLTYFAAVAAIIAAVSCSKDRGADEGNVAQDATRSSVVYEFPEGSGRVRSIEATDDGLYVACLETETRASGTVFVFKTGSYTYSKSERVYEFHGLGKMTVGETAADGTCDATIRLGLEETQTATATVRRTEASGSDNSVCGTWKVQGVLVSVSRGELVVSHQFNLCSFAAMIEYFTNKGFDLSAAGKLGDLVDDAVEKLAFTTDGTFVVAFGEADPYVGTWAWKNAGNGTFAYDLSVSNGGGILIARKGQGTITVGEDSLEVGLSSYYGGMDFSVKFTLVR